MDMEDFDIGSRVAICNERRFPCLNNITGTVVEIDYYCISVKLDHVPEEIREYEDGRIGILSFGPKYLRLIN